MQQHSNFQMYLAAGISTCDQYNALVIIEIDSREILWCIIF